MSDFDDYSDDYSDDYCDFCCTELDAIDYGGDCEMCLARVCDICLIIGVRGRWVCPDCATPEDERAHDHVHGHAHVFIAGLDPRFERCRTAGCGEAREVVTS